MQFRPKRAAYRASVGTAIEDCANDLGLARAGVTMLANVAVETKRAVVTSLYQAFALKKVNGKNRGVPAVAAAERQRAVCKIANHSDRPPLTATILVVQPRSVSHIDSMAGISALWTRRSTRETTQAALGKNRSAKQRSPMLVRAAALSKQADLTRSSPDRRQ